MGMTTRQLKKLRNETAPDPAFKEALWYELDAAFVRMYPSSVGPGWRRMILFPAAAMVLVMTLGTGTYAYASSSVTSESMLYPLKRGIESVESRFYAKPAEAADFHLRMMHRRLQERETMMLRATNEDALQEIDGEAEQTLFEAARVEMEQEKRQEKMRNISEQIRVRVKASELSEEEKNVLLLRLEAHMDATLTP